MCKGFLLSSRSSKHYKSIRSVQTDQIGNQEEAELVDFSYIMELGGSRPEFIQQVLTIFMENTPPGLKELEALVKEEQDWERISKQAHFLKSSVGVVKVRDMQQKLQQIETFAREKRDMALIRKLLDEIVVTFAAAEKVITEKIAAVS